LFIWIELGAKYERTILEKRYELFSRVKDVEENRESEIKHLQNKNPLKVFS